MSVRKFIGGAGALLSLLILAGCATSVHRGRYLEEIQPDSITNLVAYRSGDSLEIRYPLRGKDAFAHAQWLPPDKNSADYEDRFSVLSFEREKRAERKAVIQKSNRLPVRDSRQWHDLLQEIFAGLAPAQPGHGVLLLVQNLEVVLFRDADGRMNVVNLEKKPADVTVDQTLSGTDFSREAIRLIESKVNAIESGQHEFLFVTGDDPAFVLVDLRQRLIVFFSFPRDPEAEPLEVPGWFTVRALNSLLIRSFVVAAIKNPFTLVTRGLWHIGNSGVTVLDSVTPDPGGSVPPLYEGPGMDLAAWEKELDHIVSSRPRRGQIKFYINGDEFFPALIQSIEGATQSVDVMVYIFDTDDYAVKIADVLKERSKSVPVRVLMDDMGTLFAGGLPSDAAVPAEFRRPANIKSYLKSGSRVRVRASNNPWLTADHRKSILIDGREAFVGGMNIGREYRYDWHDLMMGVTGPIVDDLVDEYRKAWAHAGPLGDFAYAWVSLFGGVHSRKNPSRDGIEIRPLRTATGKPDIYRAQLAAIRRAKRYIYIENAYFSDDTVLSELIRARHRGVDVRVILPAENDFGIMQTCNLMMANEMIRNGIRVYAYPGMTHVKAAIYDGWACLGSANLEKMSLHISQELDLGFSDPETVARLKTRLFEEDFRRSRELKTATPMNWFDSLIKGFADQL